MRKHRIAVTAALFTILAVSSMVSAADLTWDVIAGGSGVITDGLGNWQDGAANWNNLTTDVNWNNATPDNATFGGGTLGAVGTVTVVGGVTVGDITFNTPNGGGNYIIDASTVTLSGTPTITANVGATISSVLAGTGFIKTGAGTLTLSGANTYAGTTTINAGTLEYGASDVILAGAVTISGGTLDIVTYSDTVGTVTLTGGEIAGTSGVLTSTATYDMQAGTVSAILGGGQALTKTTAGTVILSGVNTYTGLTTISAGTLSIGAATGVGTAAGGVTFSGASELDFTGAFTLAEAIALDAAGTFDTNANDVTLSGVISGASTLTKTGTGTLTLTGVNTYTGLTTINAGTLSIGAATGVGTAAGGVTFSGASELDFTGAFTLAEAIALNAAGTFDTNANDVTLSGVISGASTLTKTGTGTLTLTGINTYTGGTTVTGGTVAGEGGLAGAAPLQNAIAIGAGAELDFTQTVAATYDGVITGAGTLTKSGAARLTMSGNSAAFAGNTSLNEGTLWINGTLGGGTLTVANGATLGGTGMYGNHLVVQAGGTVGPGNSIGTLNIAGDYTPQAGSSLAVEVTVAAADLLNVTGDANLNGNGSVDVTLLESAENWPVGVSTYTIVQTGGTVNGEFATLNTPAGTATLQYALDYPVAGTMVNLLLTRLSLQAPAIANTPNQRVVGAALQARSADAGDMQTVMTVINGYPQASQVRTALNQISPASLDVSTGATLDNSRRFFDGLAEQLHRHHVPGPNEATTSASAYDDDMPLLAFGGNNDDVLALMMEAREHKRADRAEVTDGPFRLWVRQFNNWSDEDDENDIPGYDNFTTGVVLGGDVKVGDNLAVGAAIGYSNTDIDLTNGFGEGEIDSLRGSIYATWFKNGMYADAALGFGNNWYDNTRNLPFIGRRAKSDHEGQEWNAYLGGGYDFLFFGGYIGPTVSVQYTGLHEESYNETGAGALNQNIDSTDSHSLQTAVGMRLLYPIKLPDNKTTLVPEFRAKWLHEFLNDRDVSARFTGGGAAYTVDGNDVEEDSVLLGGRLNAYLSESISLYADYELQLQGSDGQTGHTVSAGLRIAW